MEQPESEKQLESIDNMYVVAEAAILLGVKDSRIHAMIEDQSLPSRFATMEEKAQLLISGRIKGVPGSGIRLIPSLAVEKARTRRPRGWEKGRTRKKRS